MTPELSKSLMQPSLVEAGWSCLTSSTDGRIGSVGSKAFAERRGTVTSTVVQRLQAAGIAAGVVQDIEDMIEHDPSLAARGGLCPIEHARLGVFGHVRTPMAFSRDTTVPFRPPGLGEHSVLIAQETAGLPAERVAALQALGVFT